MDDAAIIERLTAVRGVGRWTVEMLLIMRLGRPDVLPLDDLGIRKGFLLLRSTSAVAQRHDLEKRGARWRPYRSVASWYLGAPRNSQLYEACHEGRRNRIPRRRRADVGTLAVDERGRTFAPACSCHEGPGLSDHARNIAKRLAELGYVAFAMDYHGDGTVLTDMNEIMRRIQAFMADPTGIRGRASAALAVLQSQSQTDANRLAAIGYCFGGTTALELARSGADIKAVVGFHSGLGTARPADAKNIKGKVLVQIGADDPIIPNEQRVAFEKEMTAAGASTGG